MTDVPLATPFRRHPLGWRRAFMAAVWTLLAPLALAQESAPSELDFFEPVPVVLTATRLAQPLSDTPGAVTVVDRDTIRRSGARTLADVLRLVPGYMVSGYNGANPVAAYHAPLDEFGARNLVLVDGRSVYSITYLAGTTRGMLAVPLDDIERVEVLRGSNSAVYGANAMFGVINVVTRHAADTQGAALSLTAGSNGIRDALARLGWGDEHASHRLTVAHRADDGYRFVHDDTRQGGLSWRSDARLAADTDLLFTAGYTQMQLGEGEPGRYGNPPRTVGWRQAHVQAVVTRQLTETEQVRWSLSWDEERVRDAYIYQDPDFYPSPDYTPDILIDAGSSERRLNLEYQHQKSLAPGLRAVWGAGWKEDSAVSQPLFFTPDRLGVRDARVFGNVEWAFLDRWLLNVGVFAGHNSDTGSYASPRVMFNHHFLPDHTLRFGVSSAQKAPTLFQSHANVRYYLPAYALYVPTFVSSGRVQPESLHTTEVSYYGRFPGAGLTLDVRAYEERLSQEIKDRETGVGMEKDFQNLDGSRVRGFEYQVKWALDADTDLLVNQSFNRLQRSGEGGNFERLPPSRLSTLGLMRRLPQGWDLSVWWYSQSSMMWRGLNSRLGNTQRLDARLAKQFRWGHSRAEAALTVQALGGDQAEFTSEVPSVFTRRAFATLKLEF
ncbi:TonB-dependent receptor plug domain-containing protein [Macromonas nakdongensis]|uniref:TonB-dependent receptor plug domain-containing protein n=1 Tax=Macromonas nakdongensis TaxID=1843082 RepID=UPI000C324161|nr:TonB-dependent receptor [Macromonas nakdongensis]